MTTLLDELRQYVTWFPLAEISDLRQTFGDPVFATGGHGSYKEYWDFVLLRDGQFVQVQWRDFNGSRIIRVREVEPMERIRVSVAYVAADGTKNWAHETGLIHYDENGKVRA